MEGGLVAGAQASETQESILMQELEKLQGEKLRLKDENAKYIHHHPELQILLDEFVTEILIQRPKDILRFGQTFFAAKVAAGPQYLTSDGPPPLVVAGPSGVGKGTLINMLFEKYPSFFGFSVSHTTRPPRPGEVNGVHYHFISIEQMKEDIQQNKFIEYAQVHTNYYGTSYEAVNKIRAEGRICVLDIDIQGVQSVKKSLVECNYIFIAPPTMEELETRLRARGTETEDKIRIRLVNAKKELEYGLQEGNFQAIIVNDFVDNSFIRLLSELEKFYGSYGFRANAEDVVGKGSGDGDDNDNGEGDDEGGDGGEGKGEDQMNEVGDGDDDEN